MFSESNNFRGKSKNVIGHGQPFKGKIFKNLLKRDFIENDPN